jgi:hypothetical protein
MTQRARIALPALLALLAAAPALGQANEQTMRGLFDRNLQLVEQESREALPGLLLYPADLVEAVLVASQRPDLVVLATTLEPDDPAVGAALDEAPDDIAAAFETLGDEPKVLAILGANVIPTAVIGRVYADNPRFVGRLVGRMATEAREERQASVEAWAQRLQEDEAMLEDLERAAREFAEEQGADPDADLPPDEFDEDPEIIVVDDYDSWDDGWWYGWYGWWHCPDGICIGDLPGGDFCDWLLDKIEEYPDLCDKIIDWIKDRRAERPELRNELSDALDRWQSRHPETTMQGFMNDDGHRADRLRELGQALRESGGRETGAQLRDFIAKNPDRFPNLSRPGGTREARPGGGAARPGAGIDRRPARVTPTRPTRQVRRINPSQRQQMQRAINYHRSTWRNAGRASRPRGRAGRGGMRFP